MVSMFVEVFEAVTAEVAVVVLVTVDEEVAAATGSHFGTTN